ncbi:hypothetical protein LOK49_LG11G02810 [Camellia lanceoleosa]|uniref:Uncharacterized protein n=1 Tax=Camellia lanceoleosa TaxID=1840588 RepID=A0ACC0FY38_9ERIC|nr:hypothetical protein LOK49_LG11G02810 [Camellia lanceoleosa]
MGNCIETSTDSHEVERKQENQEKGGCFEESGFQAGGGGVRVKLVLTKDELEWLMLQLKGKSGKRLEDVLGEIERVRGKVVGWKPNLESIMESPEVLEMDRSSSS